MTYLDDAAIRRAGLSRLQRARHVRRAGQPAAAAPHPGTAAGEGRACWASRNFADLVLEDRMAHNGDRALAFLEDLKEKTERRFQEENRELEFRFAQKARRSELPVGRRATTRRSSAPALYDFDEEALRPYFPLERVVAGLFELVDRLYGMRVTERVRRAGLGSGSAVLHRCDDASGAFLGRLLCRLVSAREQARRRLDGCAHHRRSCADVVHPHLGLICGNLTPPVDDKPSLLTHREVETIFHEFGHLLHHLLSRVEIRSLAGTNVAWDFVELPSQIMENWCWERQALDLFARHYQTGEPIPEDLFQKMKRAQKFPRRQRADAAVRLRLHGPGAARGLRPGAGRRCDGLRARHPAGILARAAADDHAMIGGFTHLFASPVGYGAGYYSYKWAEVLDADAFTRFRESGIFSPEIGARIPREHSGEGRQRRSGRAIPELHGPRSGSERAAGAVGIAIGRRLADSQITTRRFL